jgi:hypothetical protein
VKDFLNESSSAFERNENSLPITSNDDIGITSDLLSASDNGKSVGWRHVNTPMNEVSTKANGDMKSMLTMAHDDIGISSDGGSSFDTEE